MAIVFDFGAVLFRWRPLAVVRAALPQRAQDEADAQHWARQIFLGEGREWAAFDRGTIAVPDLLAAIAARTGLARRELDTLLPAVLAEMQPLADSVALLERLHAAGERLFFLSNMPAPIADHLLSQHAFLRRFEAGVFSSHVQQLKPEPAIFATAEQRFGLPGAALHFLDDHLPNVEAARAAGWSALHFRDAAEAAAELALKGVCAAQRRA
jgi:putative hydrolase of the HAD superfamily